MDQSEKTRQVTSQTWIPVVAGALSIVSGAMGLIGVAFLIAFGAFGTKIAYHVLTAIGIISLQTIDFIVAPLSVISLVAIVGGIYAVQRKAWALALVGSICALITQQILGIIAIVFIAISKKDFE